MRSTGNRISARSASGALAASASSRATSSSRPLRSAICSGTLPIGSPWFDDLDGQVGTGRRPRRADRARRRTATRADRAPTPSNVPRSFTTGGSGGRWPGAGGADPLPQRDVRGQRVLQRHRRRVDLFEPHLVRLRRVDDDARVRSTSDREYSTRRSTGRRCQQRHALREQAAQLAGSSEPRRLGDLRVERVDLRLELALRLHRVLARGVADAHRRQAGERLRARPRPAPARTTTGTATRQAGGLSWASPAANATGNPW